jgi:hypothetical protein
VVKRITSITSVCNDKIASSILAEGIIFYIFSFFVADMEDSHSHLTLAILTTAARTATTPWDTHPIEISGDSTAVKGAEAKIVDTRLRKKCFSSGIIYRAIAPQVEHTRIY